ncbi:MAG: HepT-like ribonuclease domain-containing protein [Fimbriimonadales bacterium]
MKPETEKLLTDALEAGRAVLRFVSGRSLGDYENDLMLRSAVERQMFIVGEAISQLVRSTRQPLTAFQKQNGSSAFGICLRTDMGKSTMPACGT